LGKFPIHSFGGLAVFVDEYPETEAAKRAKEQLTGEGQSASAVRTWTDRSDKWSVEAELVSVADGMVTLKKADATTATVPIEKFSDEDQQFMREQTEAGQ
jgi:hypothetical protein